MRVSYFLGIDGGGSQTTCVLGDESRVLASVTVGGSNIVRLGERQARAALEHGVRDVCKAAAINPAQITAVCAGIAGAAREQNRAQIAGELSKLVRGQIMVVGDMEIAHQAALNGDPGIVVISGTGSIAYGRDASGHTARAGGLGICYLRRRFGTLDRLAGGRGGGARAQCRNPYQAERLHSQDLASGFL